MSFLYSVTCFSVVSGFRDFLFIRHLLSVSYILFIRKHAIFPRCLMLCQYPFSLSFLEKKSWFSLFLNVFFISHFVFITLIIIASFLCLRSSCLSYVSHFWLGNFAATLVWVFYFIFGFLLFLLFVSVIVWFFSFHNIKVIQLIFVVCFMILH